MNIQRFFDRIFIWFYMYFKAPLTVACDRAPFYYPLINEQEVLIHTKGLFAARSIAKRWVRKHPAGMARIIEGHIFL
jgi:membrane-anchored protein YejM (alkaline phosphatase superfamily)